MLRRAFRLPYLPIWLFPLLLFSPVILAGKSLFWGTPALQFLPWRAWALQTLLSGHLPLWNPMVGMGSPLIANYQSGLFYPPNWIEFLIGAVGGVAAMAWGQSLLVVMHLILAGIGMAALMDRLKFGSIAQTISGLAFSLSGYLVARAGFLSINAAAAWLPWVILGITAVVQENLVLSSSEGRRRPGVLRSLSAWLKRIFSPAWLGLCAASGLQLLAGHAQTTWYTLLLAAAWGSYLALVGKGGFYANFNDTGVDVERRLPEIPLKRRTQPMTDPGVAEPSGQQRAGREISASIPGFISRPRTDGNGWHGKLSYNQIKEKSNGHNLVTWPASWWKSLLISRVNRAQNAIRRLFESDWKGAGRRLAGVWIVLAIGLAFSIALAAVQLLPTAEFLLHSQRASAYDYERAMTYSLWPWRFLTLVAPGMFGSPATGDYWGYGFYWEDAIYIGLLPFLLGISALFSSRKGKQLSSLSAFLASVILISFLLALGKNTPFFPWLYRNVPTFDMFQAPARFTLWAVFALALLAGIGVEIWRRPEARSQHWTRLGVMGAFAIALGAAVAWYFIDDIRPSFIRSTALASAFLTAAGVLALLAPRRGDINGGKRRKIWSWAVILLVGLDLTIAGWGLNPGVESAFYSNEPTEVQTIRTMAGDGRIYLSEADEYDLKYERFLLAERFQSDPTDPGWKVLRASLLPNLNMLDGVLSANNFDPLVPGRYATWMKALEEAGPELRESLLNLMGVKVVEKVGTDGSSFNQSVPEFDARTAYHTNEPLLPYEFEPRENMAGAVRARWITCWRVASNAQDSLEQVFSGEIDLSTEVIVEESKIPVMRRCSTSSDVDLSVSYAHPNQIDVNLRANADGYIVLSDVWYPGWQAWIDGRPESVLRADYLFRAVPVKEGEHRITLTYRPVWFYLGVVISLLAWCGLLVSFTRSKKLW